MDGNIILKNFPIVEIVDGSKIIIGNNVTLNSRNFGYHVSMYSKVKLIADRPGAIISIGENSRIHGSCIHAYKSIKIGKNCLIAANSNIFDTNGHPLSFNNVSKRIYRNETVDDAEPIVIEDNVWFGLNSIILPGVIIGEGSVIAAGSVVSKDVPPNKIYGGNPARLIKK